MTMPVAAIILAAGGSRRLGQPKQLLTQGAETMMERAIRLANEAGAKPVIAVLGAHQDLVSAAVPRELAIPVVNSDWEQGIASSIHAGLRALEEIAPDACGAMMLGCDQPRLTSDHLRNLLDGFREPGAAAIAASAYAGTLGVPAIFSRAVFGYLMDLRGDKGARALLMLPPCPLIAVDFPGGEIDIDLPADLAELE